MENGLLMTHAYRGPVALHVMIKRFVRCVQSQLNRRVITAAIRSESERSVEADRRGEDRLHYVSARMTRRDVDRERLYLAHMDAASTLPAGSPQLDLFDASTRQLLGASRTSCAHPKPG